MVGFGFIIFHLRCRRIGFTGSTEYLDICRWGHFVCHRIPQHQRGRSLGYIFSVGDLGSAIGPPIALSLVGMISLPTLFLSCGVLLALTGLYTSIFAWQEHKQKVQI